MLYYIITYHKKEKNNMENKLLPTRSEADKKYMWDLENLYPTDSKWNEEYISAEKSFSILESYKGKLSSSSKNLYDCLKKCDEISIIIDKLYVYANMRFHEDSTNSFYQSLSNKSEMLIVKYSSQTAYIMPEIIEIPETTLTNFINTDENLKIYSHFLENIIRQKSHTLSDKEEEILAKTSEISDSAESIFVMINDADIKFPDINDASGNLTPLTKGRYVTFLESSDRTVRKAAFDALYSTYCNQKNTLSATYYSNVKKDIFYSSVRKYPSSLECALDNDKIPVSVYSNLIETAHKYIPLLHRYVDLRKKMLGLDELHMYDLYVPLVAEADMKITYEEAKLKVIEGLAPMGDDYINSLKKGLNGGWIDVYENQGKRGGAYSWGTYSGHPYVLLNHNDTINSMFTLAHEMGHALHSYYTWETQPYIYSGHKIFVAEVASTVNEALLMEHMLKVTTDKKTEKYLINYFLEQFRGTFFRQTMFAEFEKITHEMVERGEPLTHDILNKIYHDLNVQYFGSGIIVDDAIDIEWARIPHFYNAFYVYQYATGYSAAIALSRKIIKEGEPAVKAYKEFLSKGNSEYSIDLLKGAGVDMTTKTPLENAMAVFEELLNKLEKED